MRGLITWRVLSVSSLRWGERYAHCVEERMLEKSRTHLKNKYSYFVINQRKLLFRSLATNHRAGKMIFSRFFKIPAISIRRNSRFSFVLDPLITPRVNIDNLNIDWTPRARWVRGMNTYVRGNGTTWKVYRSRLMHLYASIARSAP